METFQDKTKRTLSWWPNLGGDPEGRFLPLWVAMVAGFGWHRSSQLG